MLDIETLLDQKRLLIVCGTGGVGKTTVSASLALKAALSGKKTAVVTIDPAKRLATSLALESHLDEPYDLTPQIKELFSSSHPNIQLLEAIVPDTRKTFETFVHSISPNKNIAQKIIQNPIFEVVANEYSGANEYMALQKLLAINEMKKYDLIILDTPPSRNTTAFFKAPQVLAQFFEEKLIKWLVLPTNKILSAGMKKSFELLEKLTGARFIHHLVDLATAIAETQETFLKTIHTASTLLTSQEVGFLLVTTPQQEKIEEIDHFIKTLKEKKCSLSGILLNRTLSWLPSSELSVQAEPGLKKAFELIRSIQEQEKMVFHGIQSRVNIKEENMEKNEGIFWARLPELSRDIHNLKDLYEISKFFAS